MSSYKYIIVVDHGIEQPIIFSKLLEHKAVAQSSCMKVVSAGFVSISPLEPMELQPSGVYRQLVFTCYGKSVSLQKDLRVSDARVEDAAILQCFYEMS